MRLKPIARQVVVITGTSSGMGLATARLAAKRGARLVLAARSEDVLRKLTAELEGQGCEAIYVVADVTKPEDVESIAEAALQRFGHFDTWINLAGLTTYGTLEEVSVEDHRRLFEINYWSVFYGSMTAVKHLRKHGGALINMGSMLSDRAVPFQGPYCATKFAVKAMTDALRMELEWERAPVSVTLIKPSSIDTPLRHHGKNFMPKEPQNPPPAYAPIVAARAILHCAEVRERDITIGGAGRLIAIFSNLMPGLTDRFMARVMHRLETTNNPAGDIDDNSLYHPMKAGEERGGTSFVFNNSLYTHALIHRRKYRLAGLGAGVAVLGLVLGRHRTDAGKRMGKMLR